MLQRERRNAGHDDVWRGKGRNSAAGSAAGFGALHGDLPAARAISLRPSFRRCGGALAVLLALAACEPFTTGPALAGPDAEIPSSFPLGPGGAPADRSSSPPADSASTGGRAQTGQGGNSGGLPAISTGGRNAASGGSPEFDAGPSDAPPNHPAADASHGLPDSGQASPDGSGGSPDAGAACEICSLSRRCCAPGETCNPYFGCQK